MIAEEIVPYVACMPTNTVILFNNSRGASVLQCETTHRIDAILEDVGFASHSQLCQDMVWFLGFHSK